MAAEMHTHALFWAGLLKLDSLILATSGEVAGIRSDLDRY